MSEITINKPASGSSDIPSSVATRLRSLRRKILLWVLADGFAWILWLVVLLAAFDLLLDWLFHMDLAQRGIMLALMVAGLIAMVAWRLGRPLSQRPGDDALCLEVEQQNRQLGEAMISSVQFSRMGDVSYQGVSKGMVQATIQAGSRAAENINFGQILNAGRFSINMVLMVAAGAIVGAGVYGVATNTMLLNTWYQRNILLADVDWPRDIDVEILGVQENTLKMVRGEDRAQLVRLRRIKEGGSNVAAASTSGETGIQSYDVYIDFRSRNQPTQKMNELDPKNKKDLDRLKGLLAAVGGQWNKEMLAYRWYEATFKSKTEEFDFLARARDNSKFWHRDVRTKWVHVNLDDPPMVDDLQLTVSPPSYARKRILVTKEDEGAPLIDYLSVYATDYSAEEWREIIARGGVTVDQQMATIDKVLSEDEQIVVNSVLLPPGKGPYYVLNGSSMELRGNTNKPLRDAKLRLNGEDRVWPLKIADSKSISGSVATDELLDGKYTIELKDTTGLTSLRPTAFRLNVRLDREPRIRARLHGISGMVVPQAMVPMSVRVKDDYAVNKVGLDYEWQSSEGGSSDNGSVPFEGPADLLGQPEFGFDDIFDLQPLKFSPGITLTFTVQATDNDEVTGPKTGQSSEFLLRVVTEEQLRTDLLRREKEQRQEFERLLKNQEDLLTEIRALAADASREQQPFNKEQKDKIRDTQRRQKLIGTNIETIARRLETFLIEAQNNRLEKEGSRFHVRLQRRVIEPMYSLSLRKEPVEPSEDNPDADASDEPNIPSAEDGLHKARRLDTEQDFAQRDQTLDLVTDEQEEIVRIMRDILTYMVKTEGFQAAVNLLYEVEKAQKNVLEMTEEELEDLLKKLFGDGGKADLPSETKGKDKDGDSPSKADSND